MKIGQFSDSFIPVVDGVGRVVYYYCDTLAKKGHECSAIVPLTDMGYRGKYPFEIIDYYCAEVPSAPQYKGGVPLLDIHYHQQIAQKKFDIVHIHTPFIAGFEGIRYAKKHNIPIVGTFHSKYYDDFYQLTDSKLLATIGTDVVVDFYNECDEVWAVSENSADTLRSYGYKKDNIHVMENGMEIRNIDKSYELIVKEKFNLNDDPILLFVGQMNFKKNIQKILEAASLLFKDQIKFQLVLAGQGPHEKEIKQEIEKLGISDVTKCVGHISDTRLLDGLYSLSSIFVFPSIYDNAPMVVREAANAYTPSIVVDGSSAGEVITDGFNGLKCKDDSCDLYNVIKENINNKEKLETLGKNARDTIIVSWDKIIDEVLNRYQNLIDKKK